MAPDPDREPRVIQPVLELDRVFEALAHPRRRYLLYALFENDEVALSDLAVEVAVWENDVSDDDVGEDVIERTYVSLYHAHVPNLAADDVVRFDEATGTIRPGPNAEQTLAVLRNAGGSTESKLEGHARDGNSEGCV